MGDLGAQPESKVPEWRQRALKHRQRQLSLFPAEWRIDQETLPPKLKDPILFVESRLSELEREITSLEIPLHILQRSVASRQYSAIQVTNAFCHRAALLQQTTGCLTEILFDSALALAKSQDEHLAATGNLLGPLHGIPISIKDNQDVKGIDSTLGWVGLIDRPAKADTPIVETLRQAGAIIYCKTNIPQSLMMSDSYNHLYGQSVNSLNRNLISGGSSGGEGALIAAGGSIAGIGTDIGGSVRIPAVLQGLYGLSPSTGRISNRESTRRDKYVVPPCSGPLTRDIDSLSTFMEVYTSQSPWLTDPGILPIPWRGDIVSNYAYPNRKLRIAYITDDGVIRPQPPIVRAVESTISNLTTAGHECISWNHIAQSHHARAYNLWLRAVLADGGSRFKALSQLPPTEPLIEGMLVGRPDTLLDVEGRMALYDEIWEFQREYMALWNDAGIDALVMPVTQWVGLRPKMWVKADMYVGYTSIWNLMNWTALAVPAIKVDREVDVVDEEWRAHQPRSFSDRFNHEKYEELLDEGELDGMPVGVQIVTGRLEEEKAVGIAKMLLDL